MNTTKPTLKPTLYYVHDPMCSWCWAFHKTWLEVQKTIESEIDIEYLVGGLAADSDEPMPLAMQNTIEGYWRVIQTKVPGTEFNFDFWKENQPRRSTYPSCRAVLAVKQIDPSKEQVMIHGIQKAYYLHAQNPSDISVLANVAESIHINRDEFLININSEHVEKELQRDIVHARSIGAQGFPSLILKRNKKINFINIDYNSAQYITNQLLS